MFSNDIIASFNELEISLYNYICQNGEKVAYMRIRELAEETHALSVSGENPFTVTHLNQLKQEGSKIISITNNKLSTIAKVSDINIPYYATEEFFEQANITTQVPVVYILESMDYVQLSIRFVHQDIKNTILFLGIISIN